MKRFWVWVKGNWPLLLVLVIGAVIRFYRLRDLTTFGGDQGVDYARVAGMIMDRKLSLLGPVTHVGIYLGPLYYYLLIPFFLLFKFDPMAAPVMMALFGTATVGIIFLLAKDIFRQQKLQITNYKLQIIAMLTALLYAVSPVIVESSRAPSQPHLIPFFAALLLISLMKIVERKQSKWEGLWIGICLASMIQFHFLAYPVFLVAAGVLFWSGYKKFSRGFWKFLGGSILILLAPWVTFELRHKFFITGQVTAYLKSGEVSLDWAGVFFRGLDLWWFSFEKLVGMGSQLLTLAMLVATITGWIGMVRARSVKIKRIGWLLLFYMLINVLGVALYVDPLSNHYISAWYPVVIVMTVAGIMKIFSPNFGMLLISGLILFGLSRGEYTRNYGYTMADGLTTSVIQKGAAIIASDTPTNNFEVANILDGDTRAGPYRYVLAAVHGKPPMAYHEYPEAQVLYVIARDNEQEVLNHRVWEIAGFGPKKIANKWKIGDNIFVYRLEKELVL